MSDGLCDSIAHFHEECNWCINFMVRYHLAQEAGKLEQEIPESECGEFHRRACSIPRTFWINELKLPQYLLERFDEWSSAPRMPDLEELFFLLRQAGRFTQLVQLQKGSKYCDRIILFVDETGSVLPNGVHFQDRWWSYYDGDQDILLGLAKKRCYKQPFVGKRPVLIAGIKYRYRKQGFTLKDVVDIHGRHLGKD